MSCEILSTVFLNAPAAIRNGNVEDTPGEKRLLLPSEPYRLFPPYLPLKIRLCSCLRL